MTTVTEETPKVRHTLRILNSKGDERTEWSSGDTATIEKAEAKFDEIVKGLKFLAFTAPADGSMGTAIRDFDPEADIVVVPQMQGG